VAAEETKHYLTNGAAEKPAPSETLEWAGQTRAQMVDLKFCDLLGTWQHVTLPLSAFGESAFDEGLGFDGSSIRGWQGIAESDMLLMPDAGSAVLDPFTEAPTLSLLCEIADPITREGYGKDPRRIARAAEEYLTETGIADTAYFGPECEFFVLDSVSYELADHRSHYAIDSEEGHWNSAEPGLGYTVRPKEGYFPPAPHDTLHDLRTQMVLTLERLGIPCEFHHHEVASGGQCEIDLRYGSLTRMADQVMTYKYVVKNVARAAGKTVTFMPKPLYGDNGSGMHTHQSLWKEGTPLMADKSGYAGLSQLARA
jgi:glutamine synthetase